MAEATLHVQEREAKGKQAAKQMRREGHVPGVLYGSGQPPSLVSMDSKDLFNLLHSFGRNSVVNLIFGDGKKKIKTFIFDIQHDPITDSIIHVDFKRISLTEKIHVTVPIHLHGTPVGVKNEGGIVERTMYTLDIRCLPTDIPEEITFDISNLHMGDVIHVKDIKQEKFEILSDIERTIVHVIAPRIIAVVEEEEEVVEEELELEESEEPAEPEIIGKKEKEGE